ncbi:MAG: hypothetical protein WKF78_09200 [Candidatus Limnocylindrales bacterium]
MFYLNVPIGIAAIALAWAASAGWETPRHEGRLDVLGALLFGLALASGLIALTLLGSGSIGETGLDPATVTLVLAAISLAATIVAILRATHTRDPFLDVRLFRRGAFASAAVVSLLTGYAFATAIIGAAVFVDRVLYGGPEDQRLALGALAGATAVGALASGFLVRIASYRVITLAGLALSVIGLGLMARWTVTTPIGTVALTLATFGLGFGLTVTPAPAPRSRPRDEERSGRLRRS